MNQTIKSLFLLFTVLMALALPNTCMPYEVIVHEKMSGAAFDKSILDCDYLTSLGLNNTQEFVGKNPKEWVVTGVGRQDKAGPNPFRPLSGNHFFDPTYNKGFNGVYPLTGLAYEYDTAPDWALGTLQQSPKGTNIFDIPSARVEMYKALTEKIASDRDDAWAELFERIGHMIHTMQDMAQPEHVRNDGHVSFGRISDFALKDYSRYERLTADAEKGDVKGFKLKPLLTGYPSVNLPRYREFWFGSGKGLAEFSNQNFVSPDTNLGSSSIYPWPNTTITFPDFESFTQKTDAKGTIIPASKGVVIRYIGNSFTDLYTNKPVTNKKLTAMSLFDFKRQKLVNKPMYTLDDEVHKSYARILVPMAVGYSTGLINYFFRGRMKITAPAEGIYGIMDHARVPTDPNLTAGSFTKIKLNLQNTTPNQKNSTTKEDMIGGKFYAVARYRRNPCYQDDLTGEIGDTLVPENGCDVNLMGTAPEEISLSAVLTGISLVSGAAPTALTFDFNLDPIPVGITSLYIQVVYRGPMGKEKDAVVAAIKDVSEPTYMVILNSSDYFKVNGVVYTADMIRSSKGSPSPNDLLKVLDINKDGISPDMNIDPVDYNGFRFTINNAIDVVTKDSLSVTQYSRFAVIGDIGRVLTVTGTANRFQSTFANLATRTCQVDLQTSDFTCVSITKKISRGIYRTHSFEFMGAYPAVPTTDRSIVLDIPGNPMPQPVTKINF